MAACALGACASGPHPALRIASEDLSCEQSELKLHKIYPKKVRVEGCGKEAIYVDACAGYGMEAKCGWGRQYANAFERDAAKHKKDGHAEAEEQHADQEKAAHAKPEQEEAERKAVEQNKAEQEKAERKAAKREKAEQEKAEREKAEEEKVDDKKAGDKNADEEKATAKKTGKEKADGEEASVKADEAKPQGKSAKRPKATKKAEGIDSFMK